ncbi:MAG: M28 family peptidase [Gammaproteobacteria bacterium]|nr:M28 family peptidase [Gammaproteobacteria bacterium]
MKSVILILAVLSITVPYKLSHAMEINKNNLYTTVKTLSEIIPARNYRNLESLNEAARYIKNKFEEYGYVVQEQKYMVEGREYKNIIVTAGPEDAPTMVIGAHYDVCGDQAGADDNASGVAGLLEFSRLIKAAEATLEYKIEMVAYTLEEPPFFKSEFMGSYIHAKSLYDSKRDVIGMIVLEMIGYFTDKQNSQTYPLSLMKLFYPSKGDFIALVGRFSDGSLLKHLRKNMQSTTVNVSTLKAPSFVAGVDFSDHLNYWKMGYNAVMITDTAFFRNPNYHQTSDTIETLDFDRMREVVKGLYLAILNQGKRQ